MKTVKGKPKKKFIKKNGLFCTNCNSIICSFHRHDFKSCVCCAIFVDGGNDYFRFGGSGLDKGEYKIVEVKIFEKKKI